MFLFIHDIGGSRSFWLAQIRAIFNLDKSFLDQELLEAFAVGLPGHNRLDKSFTKEGFIKKLNEIKELKAQKQAEIAEKLSHHLDCDSDFIESLKDSKITFVGHGLGGVLAFYYALKNPTRVRNIISVSCGNNFNSRALKRLWRKYKFYRSVSLQKLPFLINFFKKPRTKNMLHLLSIYPEAKGIKSAFRIMKHWDFFDEFKKITLEDQLEFLKIRILTVNGSLELLAKPKYSAALKNYLDPTNPIFQSQKTLSTSAKPPENVINRVYSWVGKNPQDNDLVDFVYDVRNFLYR